MIPKELSSGDCPFLLQSPSGLRVQVNANGSIRRLDCGDILLNLFLGTEIEGGPANVYLRRHGASIEATPLLGPRSPAALRLDLPGASGVKTEPGRSAIRGPDPVHADQRVATAHGEWKGIRLQVSLVLAESAPAWFWHVVLQNTGGTVENVDLIYAQDLALAHYGAVRINEYYTSHYVDHTALSHPGRGFVVASRQNLSMGGRNPWTLIGSLDRGVRYATDALQFHGLATRAGRPPLGLTQGLPGARLQHEHSMAVIQDAPVRLEPGQVAERGFFGWFEADHPQASAMADLAVVDRLMALPEALPPRERSTAAAKPAATLLSSAPLLDALDLTEAEIVELFGLARREEEREEGSLLSFFADTDSHVVLKGKELRVLRPHVHILRTGQRLIPDEASLTSTAWMGGVFHSMVTQGHVSINRILSTVHSYLSMLRNDGQRIFVELDDEWHLLDVPSAFEMTPQACRWVYKVRDRLISVRSEALTERHELTVSVELIAGQAVRLLFVNHVAMNGDDGSESIPARVVRDAEDIVLRPLPETDVGRRFPEGAFLITPLPGTVVETVGGDELLFIDGRSRNQPFLCIVTAPALSAGFRLAGRLIAETPLEVGLDPTIAASAAQLCLDPPADSPLAGPAARLGEILPWFVHDALVHYLAPRGSEQYTGGGWGTRDICQGPVELLLALGRFDAIRDLLLRVFKAQNPNGDWPQWFMFFDRERNIRAGDSHGDIVFWPLVALSQYLTASEDNGVLDEVVPFFHPEGGPKAEQAKVSQHVERALAVIRARSIPGTRLAAYGHGDWNDSMQPFDPAMRERLCSAWTVTLHVQTLTALATAFRRLRLSERASQFEATAAQVRDEFQRRLIVDGITTGYAYFHPDGRIGYLLHPRDQTTGVSYSLLPMIHAIINDLFTPEQAKKHLDLIRAHLTGPDGARLFDRPMAYRGGPQKHFQRAETAAFFGREIGLMYTHAHLRFAEALARYGDAEGFFLALTQANPIGIRTLVAPTTLRQANCYYSSSDAAFADRYQASAEYDRVRRGEVPLDGGWRIYSSGAGIWTRLLLECFLGLRRQKSALVVDPVIPRSLDRLGAETDLDGHRMEVTYRIRHKGSGPLAVNLNGQDLPFTRSANPYRTGAAEVPMKAVREGLRAGANQMTVHLD